MLINFLKLQFEITVKYSGYFYILSIYIISSIVQTGFGLNMYSIVMMVLGIVSGMVGGIVGVNLKMKSR